jgi:hypothetical protein
VIHSAWGRGKIDLPPGIAKKLNDTRVFVGSDIREPRFRKDLAKSMRVERVSDDAKNQKFKVKDERQSQQVDQGRKQEIDKVSAEAARGNKEAAGQAHKLEQQQRNDTRAAEKTQRKAVQQPQGQRIGNPAKPQAQKEVSQPQEQVQTPQLNKHEAKQQSQGVPSQGATKHERKQGPPAAGAQGNEKGGKGKGKGKP